jgi:opacity protein-like surface antigen
MAGLVPAIHVLASKENKTWMPGTRPGMTFNNFFLPYASGGSAWLMTRFTVGNARRSARSISSTPS